MLLLVLFTPPIDCCGGMFASREFNVEYRKRHAGAAPPAGAWAREYPHLAKAGYGPCLKLRQNLLSFVKPLIRDKAPKRKSEWRVAEERQQAASVVGASTQAAAEMELLVAAKGDGNPGHTGNVAQSSGNSNYAAAAMSTVSASVPTSDVGRAKDDGKLSQEDQRKRTEARRRKRRAVQKAAAAQGLPAWTSPKARPIKAQLLLGESLKGAGAGAAAGAHAPLPASQVNATVSKEDRARGIVGYTADGRAIISMAAADPRVKRLERKARPLGRGNRVREQGRVRLGTSRKRLVAVSPSAVSIASVGASPPHGQ